MDRVTREAMYDTAGSAMHIKENELRGAQETHFHKHGLSPSFTTDSTTKAVYPP